MTSEPGNLEGHPLGATKVSGIKGGTPRAESELYHCGGPQALDQSRSSLDQLQGVRPSPLALYFPHMKGLSVGFFREPRPLQLLRSVY